MSHTYNNTKGVAVNLLKTCRIRWNVNLIIIVHKCLRHQPSIIIISLSPLLGTVLPYGLHIRRTGHYPPRGPSAGWWVLTTANAAGANSLTCFSKHGGARDNKYFGHLFNVWPTLLNFRDRTPKRTGRRAIELLDIASRLYFLEFFNYKS
jgi:hypothetical protein